MHHGCVVFVLARVLSVVGDRAVSRLVDIVRRYPGKCARRARAPHMLISLVKFTSFKGWRLAVIHLV